MKTKLNLLVTLLFLYQAVWSQMQKYTYERQIPVVSDGWYKISIPGEMYGKISANLRDIRIYGITSTNDTIETPYLLRVLKNKVSNKDVSFKVINVASSKKGYYFTFETTDIGPVNQIIPDFNQKNFDWSVTLEGSQTLQEWFVIAEKYRILSIKNNLTDFRFTTISFSESTYRYYRLFIESQTPPELLSAKIEQHKTHIGEFINYQVKHSEITNNPQTKETIVDIDLEQPVPVSFIKLRVKDKIDFFRPLTVEYLADSFLTEKGWKYNYQSADMGILNSFGSNEFTFQSTITQKLRLHITNQDSRPLTIDSIWVKGYVHELVARFTGNANYFLVYGYPDANFPIYDLDHFTERIPDTLPQLIAGKEQLISKEKILVKNPLFQNKLWLWVIIILTILLLAWFTSKMMKKA